MIKSKCHQVPIIFRPWGCMKISISSPLRHLHWFLGRLHFLKIIGSPARGRRQKLAGSNQFRAGLGRVANRLRNGKMFFLPSVNFQFASFRCAVIRNLGWRSNLSKSDCYSFSVGCCLRTFTSLARIAFWNSLFSKEFAYSLSRTQTHTSRQPGLNKFH